MDLIELKEKSVKLREKYHELEEKYHESIWTVEEDALAFLTDAGLVGRLVMDNQKRWPSQTDERLDEKIGECVWWLAVLAERTGLNLEECIKNFFNSKKKIIKD
ncbi:Uncharacterised protein [uncultured Leptotrichia sp.]|uniref:hypothetical protein n=1 Tax=uncultured Leptotrichia sp. TaxID=159271 RepID=UPI001A5A0646|nr:hypothetical protein [uncultured Leptotrichia sp.]VTX57755.1 Uncharacterised protein [uncultured Leptotrichia sp.]